MREKLEKLAAFFRDWENQSGYLKWMISQTKPFMGPLMFIFALNLLVSVTGVGSTVVTKYIIDGATGSGPDFTALGVTVLVVLTASSIAISASSSILAAYINERYAFSIRSRVYDNVLRGVWKKLVSFHSADIVTRLTSDVDRVAGGISSIIPNIFFLAVRLGIAFCVLFYYDRFLALAALALGPVGVLLSLIFSGKLKKYQEELAKNESEYRSFMQETVENISVLKTFQQEDFCSERLSALRNRRLYLVMKRNKLNTAMNVLIQFVFYLGYLVAFSWGIYRLSTQSITYGTMTIFLSLVSQVQGPIIGLGSIIPQFITVLASAGRVIEMDSISSEERAGEKIKNGAKNIGLRIQNVTFAYDRENVLDNLDLEIGSNEIVGLMGYSGSGKTTLARLILSLVHPQPGGRLVFYDDTGVTEEVSAAVRRFISYVPQGNTLFSGTIADNLRAGNRLATEEEMWEALEIADAATFVRELDGGLEANIGEKALGLSEGQAQRIAIARALIKAAPILILDEATAALDMKTEEEVIKRLCASNFLHTCFIITHRRSMLNYCTRALEIEGKQLKEIQL